MTNDTLNLRPTDVLLVYGAIETVDLPTNELRVYAEFSNEALSKDKRENLRTCVVVEDDLLFGMNRLFGSVAEVDDVTDQLIHYFTCKTVEEAGEWLSRDKNMLADKIELLNTKKLEGIENQILEN